MPVAPTSHRSRANSVFDQGKKRKPLIDPARSMRAGKINLKAVAEVLSERGLDPTEEIAKILEARFPDTVDRDTLEVVPGRYVLDAETRAKILADLLQYCQPKLKSVEISGAVGIARLDITDEQARRLASEFLKKLPL